MDRYNGYNRRIENLGKDIKGMRITAGKKWEYGDLFYRAYDIVLNYRRVFNGDYILNELIQLIEYIQKGDNFYKLYTVNDLKNALRYIKSVLSYMYNIETDDTIEYINEDWLAHFNTLDYVVVK